MGRFVSDAQRKCCILLLNAPEKLAETTVDRVEQKRKLLASSFSKLFLEGEQGVTLRAAFRLRRRPTAGERSIPLKVVLPSEEQAEMLLRRAHRLKGSDLRILRDLSPKDRVKLREATQELNKRRAAGEKNCV